MEPKLDAFKEIPFNGLPMENISRYRAEKREIDQEISNLFARESSLLKHLEEAYKKISDPMGKKERRQIVSDRTEVLHDAYLKCKEIADFTINARRIGANLPADQKNKLCEIHNENNKKISQTLWKIYDRFNALAEQEEKENAIKREAKENGYITYTRSEATALRDCLLKAYAQIKNVSRKDMVYKAYNFINEIINNNQLEEEFEFSVENFDRRIVGETRSPELSIFYRKIVTGYEELEKRRAK